MKNFYHILGLSLEPAPEQQLIEAAYRALVKLYHPDVYKGDKKSLKRKISEINEAYDTLSDNKKREDYDKNLKKIQIDKSFQFTDDEFEDKVQIFEKLICYNQNESSSAGLVLKKEKTLKQIGRAHV